jgi:hypothetical protein
MTIQGFTIEKIEGSEVAYKLHGKKGKVINLVRNQQEAGIYFMINAKTWNEERIEGCDWVREVNGELRLFKPY